MSMVERCAKAILMDYERQISSGEVQHMDNGDVHLNASSLVRAMLEEMLEFQEELILTMGAAAILARSELAPHEAQAEQIASEVFGAMVTSALAEMD